MTLCLVLDSETTGVPARGEIVTSPAYPHIVELAALLVDDEVDREVASFSLVVRPDGWEISDEVAAVHGISHTRALRVGVPLQVALGAYLNLRAVADEVAGHNVQFDLGIVSAAIHRLGRNPSRPGPDKVVCTAELGTPICAIPPTDKMVAAGYGANFKKPTLSELHAHLFGEPFENAHSALADCRACARCLFEIRRRGS
jgi:DNA polymerase-3 subunit epsilon